MKTEVKVVEETKFSIRFVKSCGKSRKTINHIKKFNEKFSIWEKLKFLSMDSNFYSFHTPNTFVGFCLLKMAAIQNLPPKCPLWMILNTPKSSKINLFLSSRSTNCHATFQIEWFVNLFNNFLSLLFQRVQPHKSSETNSNWFIRFS